MWYACLQEKQRIGWQAVNRLRNAVKQKDMEKNMEYAAILSGKEYDFIKNNEHLGRHVILLGLAGSYAYGTNNENSDIDVGGVALNRKSDLIRLTEFEQYVDAHTDTTIYTFNKIITLLLSCNPNTVELLGLRTEWLRSSQGSL